MLLLVGCVSFGVGYVPHFFHFSDPALAKGAKQQGPQETGPRIFLQIKVTKDLFSPWSLGLFLVVIDEKTVKRTNLASDALFYSGRT